MLFLAPAVVIYSLFVIVPILGSFRIALYAEPFSGGEEFVGLDNFRHLFLDPRWADIFSRALGHTGLWFLIHVVIQNTIGLGLALLLTSHRLRLRGLFRTIIFTPTVISVVIVGFVFKLILSPLWGVSPEILGLVGLESLYEPWLGQEDAALITLSLMSVWQYVGISMLLFSAALIGIPDDLIEAARVDGAGTARIFRNIQLPLILPTIGVIVVLTFVGASRAFDLIYAVQGPIAGPNYSTDVVGTLFYRTLSGFFTELPNRTMAATLASVTVAFVGAIVAIYLLVVQRRLQRYEA